MYNVYLSHCCLEYYHSFWEGLFNNKKPTYRNKGPTLPIRGSIYLYNPRHPATDKHSNTSHNTEVRSHDDVLLSYGWWRKTKWVTHYLTKLSKYNIPHEQDVGQLDTVSRGNPINQVNETLWEMLCWWKHWKQCPSPRVQSPGGGLYFTICHLLSFPRHRALNPPGCRVIVRLGAFTIVYL